MEQWLLTRLRMGRIFGHKGNIGHFTTTYAVTVIVMVIDIDGTGGGGGGSSIRYNSRVVTRTITHITIVVVVIIATIIVMVVEQIRRLVQMILEGVGKFDRQSPTIVIVVIIIVIAITSIVNNSLSQDGCTGRWRGRWWRTGVRER